MNETSLSLDVDLFEIYTSNNTRMLKIRCSTNPNADNPNQLIDYGDEIETPLDTFIANYKKYRTDYILELEANATQYPTDNVSDYELYKLVLKGEFVYGRKMEGLVSYLSYGEINESTEDGLYINKFNNKD